MRTNNKQSGFTLVELAIVLVIIGLIVGGVLVGQDLIKAATLQKGIRQLTDTEAGATTFRTKYNALPGDYNGTQAATQFTGPTTFTAGNLNTRALGDQNGAVEATSDGAGGVTASLGASGEVAAFYPQLYDAGYIKEAMNIGTANTLAMTNITLTSAAIRNGTFYSFVTGGTIKPLIVPGSFNGRNYLTIVGAPTAAAAAGIPTWGYGLTSLDASSIDGKLDDGNPATGGVIVVDATAPVAGTLTTNALDTGAGNCFTVAAGATPAYYNTSVLTQKCNISYRASF